MRLANANALDTHDTARAASHMIEGGQQIAACAQFSFPGIPLVFAGDEFGLKGFNGEDSRTPMPWDAPEQWGADLRGLYADLAALRTEHRALVDGSLRFIHAEGDLLVYVREHASGSVLCVVSRGPVPAIAVPAMLAGSETGIASEPLCCTWATPRKRQRSDDGQSWSSRPRVRAPRSTRCLPRCGWN